MQESTPAAPVPTWSATDVLCIPGLAFDRAGRRLGRGGGHYDALLTQFPGQKIGVCFAVQVQAEIPCDPWDQQVDLLVTEADIIVCEKE